MGNPRWTNSGPDVRPAVALAALDHDQPCTVARLLLPPGAGPGAGYPTGVHCPRCPHRQLPKQEAGKAVQSSHRWIFVRGLIGGLTVLAVLGCDEHWMCRVGSADHRGRCLRPAGGSRCGGDRLGHDRGAWGTGGSIAAEVVAGPPIASMTLTPWSQKAPRRRRSSSALERRESVVSLTG